MINHGIVLVALGYPLYGNSAFNLAIGLKAYDPKVQIAIIHDKTSLTELTHEEKKVFDTFIELPEKEYLIDGKKQYPRAKLLFYKYSPYDHTIYMDVDNIWHPYKKVSHLFGEMMQHTFLIGQNGTYDPKTQRKTNSNYTFWGECSKICEYHKITGLLPQTISGFFYFKKCKEVEKIFEDALSVYDDPNTPSMVWAAAKPDEYCFNVALAWAGHRQQNYHVFYFDKINGANLPKDKIYSNFWGMAVGGHKVAPRLIDIYNRLVNKYCSMANIMTRHYHIDKAAVIEERKIY